MTRAIERLIEEGIDVPADIVELAEQWHGGQATTLYAISSTGRLRLGSIRPRNDEGIPMTDAEWLAELCDYAELEFAACARSAAERPDLGDATDLTAAATFFAEYASKVREWIDVINAEEGI